MILLHLREKLCTIFFSLVSLFEKHLAGSWLNPGPDPDFPEICPTLRVDISELNEDFFKILNVL